MTSISGNAPLMAGDVLFPRGDAVDGVSAALSQCGMIVAMSGIVPHLSSAGRGALTRQIVEQTAGILNLDVLDLVVRTLSTYDELIAAADRTCVPPNTTEIVQLLSVPVTWTTDAEVQVLVDGVTRLRLQLQVEVTLTINVEAKVSWGRLSAIQTGQCEVSVTLRINNFPIQGRRTIDLTAAVPLGTGIPLGMRG